MNLLINIIQVCILFLLPCCSKSMFTFCSTTTGYQNFSLKIFRNIFLLLVIEISNIIIIIPTFLIYMSALNSMMFMISFIIQKIIFMTTMILIASGTGFLAYQCQQVLLPFFNISLYQIFSNLHIVVCFYFLDKGL